MSEKPREEVIAQNLALYRKLHGFTQAQLADAIGYSDKSISKWERGDGTPDIFLLLTLSEIYGITVSELVGQTEKCKSTQEKIKYAEHDRKELERAKKKALWHNNKSGPPQAGFAPPFLSGEKGMVYLPSPSLRDIRAGIGFPCADIRTAQHSEIVIFHKKKSENMCR